MFETEGPDSAEGLKDYSDGLKERANAERNRQAVNDAVRAVAGTAATLAKNGKGLLKCVAKGAPVLAIAGVFGPVPSAAVGVGRGLYCSGKFAVGVARDIEKLAKTLNRADNRNGDHQLREKTERATSEDRAALRCGTSNGSSVE